MLIHRSVRRNLKATLRAAKSLRKSHTDAANAVSSIVSRLAMLDSDELYERPGHVEGRIPAAYKVSYRQHLEDALALLVEAEDVYLRQRENIRCKRAV